MAGFGGSVKLVGATEYKNDLKQIGQRLKEVTTEMKAQTSAFDRNDTSTAALQKKQESLNKTLDVAKSKVKTLTDQYNDFARRTQEQTTAHNKLQKEYDEQKAKLEEIGRTLGTTSKEYQEQAKVVDKLEKELKDSAEAEDYNKKSLSEKNIELNKAVAESNKYQVQLDRVEGQLEENRKAEDGLADATKKSGEAAKAAAQDGFTVMKGVLANLAADVIRRAADGLKNLATNMVQAGMDFDSAMSKVAAVSGATGDELTALTDKAKEMGEKTKFSATESAEAFNYMAMAGWKTEDMLNGIEGIMNLAAASGEDLATTSDIVTDALTAMGYSAGDAGKLADVMAAASSNANTNVAMMGQTFQYAAPIIGAMGYNMEDAAVAIGLMANAGIKGEKAGTALRSVLTRLAAPPAECAKAMEKLGISLTDNEGKMKPFSSVMDDLRKKFAGLSETQQTQYAKSIAGAEAMSGLLAIVNAAPADYAKLTKAVESSNGAAQRMADTMNDNVGGQMTLLKSKIEGVYLTIYKKLEPSIRKAIDSISKTIDKIDWNAFGERAGRALEKLANGFNWILEHRQAIVAALGAILAAMAIKKVNDFTTSLSNAGKHMLNMVTEAKAAATGQAALGTAMGGATTAIKGSTTAMNLLSMAFRANPIGMVVTGITLAVGAFNLLAGVMESARAKESEVVTKNKELKKSLDDIKSGVDEARKSYENSLGAVEEQANSADFLMRRLEALEGVENKTNAQKREMKNIVDQLNKVLPDLNLKYDEEKDALNMSTDALRENIQAQKDLALAKAEQAYSEEIITKIANAEREAGKATENHKKATDEYNKAVKEREDYEKERGSNLSTLDQKYKQLLKNEKDTKKAMDETSKTVQDYKDTLSDLDQQYQESANKANEYIEKADISQALAKLNDKLKAAGRQLPQALADGINNGRYAVPESIEQMDKLINFNSAIEKAGLAGQDIPKSISEGVMTGKLSIEEAMNQVKTVIDVSAKAQEMITQGRAIPTNLAEGIRTGKVSVDEANAIMQAAITFDELKQKATDAGAAIPNNLAEQVKNGTITVQEANNQLQASLDFQAAVQKATEAGFEIPSSMAEQITAGELAPNEALQRVQALLNYQKSFNDAGLAGKAVPNALRDGILSGQMTVTEANNAMNNWIEFKKANNEAAKAGISVPSELASNIITGQVTVQQANEQMNNWIKFQDALNKTEQAGAEIPKELASKILSGKTSPEDAIKELNRLMKNQAQKMRQSGVTGGEAFDDGVSSGLNNSQKRGAITGSVSGLGDSMKSSLKSSIDAHSPSREAAKIGGYFLDGVKNGVDNRNKRNSIFSSIASFGSSLLSGLRAALQEHSPSKATEQIGKYFLEGLGVGIKKEGVEVIDQIRDLGRNMLGTLDNELGQGVSVNALQGLQNALPDELNADMSVNTSRMSKVAQEASDANMVEAFKDALSQMKIEMNGDEMGAFVDKTVTKLVYN